MKNTEEEQKVEISQATEKAILNNSEEAKISQHGVSFADYVQTEQKKIRQNGEQRETQQ